MSSPSGVGSWAWEKSGVVRTPTIQHQTSKDSIASSAMLMRPSSSTSGSTAAEVGRTSKSIGGPVKSGASISSSAIFSSSSSRGGEVAQEGGRGSSGTRGSGGDSNSIQGNTEQALRKGGKEQTEWLEAIYEFALALQQDEQFRTRSGLGPFQAERARRASTCSAVSLLTSSTEQPQDQQHGDRRTAGEVPQSTGPQTNVSRQQLLKVDMHCFFTYLRGKGMVDDDERIVPVRSRANQVLEILRTNGRSGLKKLYRRGTTHAALLEVGEPGPELSIDGPITSDSEREEMEMLREKFRQAKEEDPGLATPSTAPSGATTRTAAEESDYNYAAASAGGPGLGGSSLSSIATFAEQRNCSQQSLLKQPQRQRSKSFGSVGAGGAVPGSPGPGSPAMRPLGSSEEKGVFFAKREFFYCVTASPDAIATACSNNFVMQGFTEFAEECRAIYEEVLPNTEGAKATYIPQLAHQNEDWFGIACCTVDGQRLRYGDYNVPFCLQSCSKPITYGAALDRSGVENTHRHVGREPSGMIFNALALDRNGLPHNPLINSGAIMCAGIYFSSTIERQMEEERAKEEERLREQEAEARARAASDLTISEAASGTSIAADGNRQLGDATSISNVHQGSVRSDASTDDNLRRKEGARGCPVLVPNVDVEQAGEHASSPRIAATSAGTSSPKHNAVAGDGAPQRLRQKMSSKDRSPSRWGKRTLHSSSGVGLDALGNRRANGGGRTMNAPKGLQSSFPSAGNLNRGVGDGWPSGGTTQSGGAKGGNPVRAEQGDSHHVNPTMIPRNSTTSSCHDSERGGEFGKLEDSSEEEGEMVEDVPERMREFITALSKDEHMDTHAIATASGLSDGAVRKILRMYNVEPTKASQAVQQTPAGVCPFVFQNYKDLYDEREEMEEEMVRLLNLNDRAPNAIGNGPARPAAMQSRRPKHAPSFSSGSQRSSLVDREDSFVASDDEPIRGRNASELSLVVHEAADPDMSGRAVSEEISSPKSRRVLGTSDPHPTGTAAGPSKDEYSEGRVAAYRRANRGNDEKSRSAQDLASDALSAGARSVAADSDAAGDGIAFAGPSGSRSDAARIEEDAPHTLNDYVDECREEILHLWSRLGGRRPVGYDEDVYRSEARTADRNFALAYYMKEARAFPDLVNGSQCGQNSIVNEVLNLYFQLCALTVDCETLAIAAATLANGGVCPTTGERVLRAETVKHTLSMMYSCGMYDYSGEFAFRVGLPAKSGVAGGIMVIVPNLFGFATFSPPLDKYGNSERGRDFFLKLTERYPFHNFDIRPSIGRESILLGGMGGQTCHESETEQVRESEKEVTFEDDAATRQSSVGRGMSSSSQLPGRTLSEISLDRNQHCGGPAAQGPAAGGAPGSNMNSSPSPMYVIQLASVGDIISLTRLKLSGARNFSAPDYDKRTPLHLAASCGHLEVVEWLLENGHPLCVRDRWGNTPLDDARREGFPSVARYLWERSPTEEQARSPQPAASQSESASE
ncbi:unnamed protein product [Amoebophrya sp. A25]|nr:unnamed protein product [Amoebophrya sp. A25]|eukprot:GSA25T00013517001.1